MPHLGEHSVEFRAEAEDFCATSQSEAAALLQSTLPTHTHLHKSLGYAIGLIVNDINCSI